MEFVVAQDGQPEAVCRLEQKPPELRSFETEKERLSVGGDDCQLQAVVAVVGVVELVVVAAVVVAVKAVEAEEVFASEVTPAKEEAAKNFAYGDVELWHEKPI